MVTAVIEKESVIIYQDGKYVISVHPWFEAEITHEIAHSSCHALPSEYPVVAVGNARLYPDDVIDKREVK